MHTTILRLGVARIGFAVPILFLIAAGAGAQPVITLTQVPPCGSGTIPLEGEVSGIADPSQFAIAPYIYTGAWWTKPTFAQPTVPLTSLGPGLAAFSVDLVSHPTDKEAGYLVVFLLPVGIPPPQVSGGPSLPVSLFQNPHAEATRECATRVIRAYDRAWLVKDSGGSPVGPGPNLFPGSPDNVFVDGNGKIHLRITRRQNKWQAAEVIDISANPGVSSPGPGFYSFQVLGDLSVLDPNVVLGLFTWDTYAPGFNYREIDLEFARWGNAGDPTHAQYVVQPWDTPGNLVRFPMPPETATSHGFHWSENSVEFRSWSGLNPVPPPDDSLLAFFDYSGSDVPPAGSATANTRMNLWLFGGTAPQNGQEVEVVVSGFSHVPDSAAVVGVPAEPGPVVPFAFSVYPSPSRGPVTLRLEGAAPGDAWTLRIQDVRGALVRTLPTALAGSGGVLSAAWDGRDAAGRRTGTGVYLVVASGSGGSASRKLVRIR